MECMVLSVYEWIFILVFHYQYNQFKVSSFYDFLKKLVKEACLVDLLFVSVYDFLFVFFAGDDLFSFHWRKHYLFGDHRHLHQSSRFPRLSR